MEKPCKSPLPGGWLGAAVRVGGGEGVGLGGKGRRQGEEAGGAGREEEIGKPEAILS